MINSKKEHCIPIHERDSIESARWRSASSELLPLRVIYYYFDN